MIVKEITGLYDDFSHSYALNDGTVIPSVTEMLLGNKSFNGTTPAIKLGREIHELIIGVLNGKSEAKEELQKDAKGSGIFRSLQSLIPYYKPVLGEVLCFREFEVESKSYFLGGTADILLQDRKTNENFVIDIKTGEEKAWHVSQVAIYCLMLNATSGAVIYPHNIIVEVTKATIEATKEWLIKAFKAHADGLLINGKIYNSLNEKQNDLLEILSEKYLELKKQEDLVADLKNEINLLKEDLVTDVDNQTGFRNDLISVSFRKDYSTYTLKKSLDKKLLNKLRNKFFEKKDYQGSWIIRKVGVKNDK